ncbi:hypothetical protein CJA_0271 [Cellvibrio japonicus Ueda107]|uniref:Uncharacterized protein n=1 Tax=Cellvibrio japonicus (strain Ueda107) TaxID=498211 RepID=B3PH74_CELJU|nr:hypothetical protein CJA_0271 [Cellvibrio japonicus Ueda107]
MLPETTKLHSAVSNTRPSKQIFEGVKALWDNRAILKKDN